MIFHQFVSTATGCISYLLGCPRSGVCAVVDPRPEIGPYLEAVAEGSLRVTHIFETHVKSRELSGARRLAAATRAPVFVHESASLEFPHVEMADGEEHDLGPVRLSVLHTPGHTPDGLSLVVTDRARGSEPWFILTGETLLAGGVGRPAARDTESRVALGEQLYESLYGRLLAFADYVQVYPGHVGADVALSEKASTTIGFERRFNPALQLGSKTDFVRFVLGPDLSEA